MIYLRSHQFLRSPCFHSNLKKIIFYAACKKHSKERLSLTESEQSAALSYYTLKFISDSNNYDYSNDLYSIR